MEGRREPGRHCGEARVQSSVTGGGGVGGRSGGDSKVPLEG